MRFDEALNNPIFKTIADCAVKLELPCYVVGGFVRDFALNTKISHDIDILALSLIHI